MKNMLLLNCSHSSGASAYNMPGSWVLGQAPDVPALQAALNAVAVRHEVLRLHYSERPDGTVVGMVSPADTFSVPLLVVDVRSDEEEAAQLAEEAAAAFNLSKEPLLRGRLLKRKDGSAVLALTMHHAVGDAWSWGVFFGELSSAYVAVLSGTQPTWEALPVQYADYAAWQQEQVKGEAGQELRTWWRQSLSGAPSLLQLPLDRPRPAQPTFEAGTVEVTLPPGLMDRVDALAQQLRVNAQAVLLAALQAVLLRYSGQDDVVVGVPVAGRGRPEVQGLVGYFINTMPVRRSAAE